MTSSKVASPRLRNTKFGHMSLATYRSMRPSRFRSVATTPKPSAVGPSDSGGLGDVGEGPVAVVPVEEVPGRLDRFG